MVYERYMMMVYSNQGYMMVNRYGFQKLTICFYFTQTLDLPKKRFRVPTPALLHLDLPKDLGVDSPGIPKKPQKKNKKNARNQNVMGHHGFLWPRSNKHCLCDIN